MAQVRKVITKINRYLFEEEAHYIINTLNDFNYPNKLHKLSKTVRVLQEEIQYRYLKYLDYIGLQENKFLN